LVVYDETHWTDTKALGSVGAYFKSKTLAERAAWEVVEQHPALELSVINPYTVFGPLLPGMPEIGASIGIIQAIITRSMRIAPVFEMGAVDVRDVATMHILAMTSPAAKGQRFIAAAGEIGRAEMFTLQRIAADLGYKVRGLPDWATRLIAVFSPETKPLTLAIGYKRHLSNEKAQRVLGVKFRSSREAIDASVDSLREMGVL
jgi:dihydroflavonol-4-reductase